MDAEPHGIVIDELLDEAIPVTNLRCGQGATVRVGAKPEPNPDCLRTWTRGAFRLGASGDGVPEAFRGSFLTEAVGESVCEAACRLEVVRLEVGGGDLHA